MKYIADLHIHSPFSRATSRDSSPAGLARWAGIKGINLIGTGDFTHPGWLRLLREQLEPAEPGFFRLKDEGAKDSVMPNLPRSGEPVRFILTAETSSIYKRHGKTRKVHNLLFLPDFESAERMNRALSRIGNIESDGRPILGLDSRDLLEMLLEASSDGFLIPAHIWTPWFSIFGSKSGFDSIEECFGDLSEHIFALETGLSSDPDMNRLISALDRFALISNSDCHSPSRLGREANIFNTDFDYISMRNAIRSNSCDLFHGTIEFFPEEGKYHLDGHRECGICKDPRQSGVAGDILCHRCGRPLTIGVQNRVIELADRAEPSYPADAPRFRSVIPLAELLGELLMVGAASKSVAMQYCRLISAFGSELALLIDVEIEEITEFEPLLAEAVKRMRNGEVLKTGGYDGEYGQIKVFVDGEIARLSGGRDVFGIKSSKRMIERSSIRRGAMAGKGPLGDRG